MGEGGLGCTASVPPAGQAPLTPPPRTPRGEAAEGPPPDHAPRSGERRRRDSGGPPGGLPWPGLRSSRARGPVRAGRRQNGRLFLASVSSGKSLKVPPEAPPLPAPAEGGPNQHNAPRAAPPRPGEDWQALLALPRATVLWMCSHLPPCRSSEVSSEHIRTFRVAQKLPRCHSPRGRHQRTGDPPHPVPPRHLFRLGWAGRAQLPEGRAGERAPRPEGAARRASPPAGPSAQPRLPDSVKAKEDRRRAASRRDLSLPRPAPPLPPPPPPPPTQ